MEHTADVEGLKRRISSRQFEGWRQYMRHEPFGQDWLQAATIASAACNPHIKKPIKVDEFIPAVRREKTPAEIEAEIIASCNR